jgi:hypothetical protein
MSIDFYLFGKFFYYVAVYNLRIGCRLEQKESFVFGRLRILEKVIQVKEPNPNDQA